MYRSRLLVTLVVILFWLVSAVNPTAVNAMPAAAPEPFTKATPIDGAANQPALGMVLTWNESQGTGITYSYCIRFKQNSCQNNKWINVGTATSAKVKNLMPGGTYYWQVRAKDSTGAITYADGGALWSFHVAQKPSAFEKQTPVNSVNNIPVSGLLMSWTTSNNATRYEYCADTTNNRVCDTGWVNAGANTSVIVNNLIGNAVYYWQVRAVNGSGTTEANSGTWWQFTTHEVSAPFIKITPADQAVNQLTNNLYLSWTQSEGATGYEYCVDDSNNNTCNTAWTPTLTDISVPISGLVNDTDYYWQVRAANAGGYQYANDGVWWHFISQVNPPTDFTKAEPINGTLNTDFNVTLKWNASTGKAIQYEYCVDQTGSGLCDSDWVNVGTSLTANLTDLFDDTMYYWQVRAVNPAGTVDADSGVWWSFTTRVLMPPAMFVKSAPSDKATNVPVSLNLQWNGVDTDVTYEYCLVAGTVASGSTECTGSTWKPTGTSTTVSVSDLAFKTQYSWQVRATNAIGSTYANDNTWWTFTTQIEMPDSFVKLAPAQWKEGVYEPLDTWLYWSSANAVRYEFCLLETLDTTCSGNTKWTSAGANTSYHLTGLKYQTTYYWQVRAISGSGGTTFADGSADAWYSFKTFPTPPTSEDQTINIDEDQTLTGKLLTFTNVSGLPVTFTHVGATPPGVFALTADGKVTYIPPQDFNDTVSFQFTVTDNISTPKGPYTVTIAVAAKPDKPVIDPVASQKVRTGSVVTFQAAATDPDLADGDILTFSLGSGAPTGATIDPQTGVFTWKAKWSASKPTYSIVVIVTDTDLPTHNTAQTTVNITVTPMQIFLSTLSKQ